MSDDVATITREPDNPGLRAELDSALDRHNVELTGITDFTVVAFAARAADGTLLGGTWGYVWGDWLHVETLWLDETVRDHGLGSRLLERAESEALERGAHHAFLETHSFHARPFYERRGYRVAGELEGYPPGGAYYLMRKDLT